MQMGADDENKRGRQEVQTATRTETAKVTETDTKRDIQPNIDTGHDEIQD